MTTETAPAKKPSQKKAPNLVSGVHELNASQVLILQTLAKSGTQMTCDEIEKACPGAVCTPGNVGPLRRPPVAGEEASLIARKLVKPVFEEGHKTALIITDKGAKLAGTIKARKRTNGDRVDPAKLDAVVVKMRGQRTYGLELWTEADLKECRAGLGEEHAKLPLDTLRLQITNRRKQGAYSDPNEKRKASASKCLREFGPKGSVIDGMLTKPQVEKLQAIIDG